MARHASGRRGKIGLAGLLAALAALILAMPLSAPKADALPPEPGFHLGVASCANSTCHGRQEPTGAVVRQDEVARWQDATSQAGAHSRAWLVLGSARGRAIAARLGIGDPQSSNECLGCHVDPAPRHGPRWKQSDGVGCEACHGAASAPWFIQHYSVNATHARNVSLGLYPIDEPKARAAKCLDCHMGGDGRQFASHRIMAAGHPRLSFELGLFSALQQHWNVDDDYIKRKGRPSEAQLWAVGQAMAVSRALTLYAEPRRQAGALPEFAFFDCHSCHRRISDAPDYRPSAIPNPARGLVPGEPPFQDENMIMLSAAAHVVDPALAGRFDADARAFHMGFAKSQADVLSAGARLRGTADRLADAFAARPFGTRETFAMIHAVATTMADRYTDYEASAQAVMAIDTLLDGLVRQGAVTREQVAPIRGQIDLAYRAVRDPNLYQPADFRAALGRAATAIEGLK